MTEEEMLQLRGMLDKSPPWQTKVWGRTRCTVESPVFLRHELEVEKGGYCSVHYHNSRANRFHVLSGQVAVVQFFGWTTKRTILGADARTLENTCYVSSRVPHMFQVIESGKVIEDYWPDRGGNASNDDIVRLTRADGEIASGGRIQDGLPKGVLSLAYDCVMQQFAEEING